MKTLPAIINFLILWAICFAANAQESEKNLFPPIDIKTWDQTPCVNGRLATKAETENGTALLYYDEKEGAKPYPMELPKLAYIALADYSGESPFDVKSGENAEELVVVIQIVQTPNDTMVGFRPLSGGNGASVFHDFRFLTDEEATRLAGK